MSVLIGTSGFHYPHWENDVFYPSDLSKSKHLEYYSEYFNTVELNVTFYRLPSKEAFKGWRDRTPADFKFAVKGSRFITHIKRLKDAKEPLNTFFENATPLRTKISCILWQLGPNHHLNLERLESFVKLLTRRKGLRHAFEFRHESWLVHRVFDLIRDAGMTLCRADWPEFRISIPDDFPFEYIRRHGPHEGAIYSGCYTDKHLKRDADMIKRWSRKKKDVLIYFNNDAQGWAIKNALRLKELLRLK